MFIPPVSPPAATARGVAGAEPVEVELFELLMDAKAPLKKRKRTAPNAPCASGGRDRNVRAAHSMLAGSLNPVQVALATALLEVADDEEVSGMNNEPRRWMMGSIEQSAT